LLSLPQWLLGHVWVSKWRDQHASTLYHRGFITCLSHQVLSNQRAFCHMSPSDSFRYPQRPQSTVRELSPKWTGFTLLTTLSPLPVSCWNHLGLFCHTVCISSKSSPAIHWVQQSAELNSKPIIPFKKNCLVAVFFRIPLVHPN